MWMKIYPEEWIIGGISVGKAVPGASHDNGSEAIDTQNLRQHPTQPTRDLAMRCIVDFSMCVMYFESVGTDEIFHEK